MKRGQAPSVITSGWGRGRQGVALQPFALHTYVILFPIPLSHFFILLQRPLSIQKGLCEAAQTRITTKYPRQIYDQFCYKDHQSCNAQGTLYFQGAAQLIQGEAQLSRVHCSPEGCRVAQKGTAQLRMLLLCSQATAQLRQGEAQLRKVRRSSKGCSASYLRGCSVA